jgi:outer membrane protein assembly factor BamD
MSKKVTLIVIGILLLTSCSSIPWFQTDLDKSVEELAADGMDAYQEGNYKEAIEHFEKLKDFYPFSKYASLAELKIADAHYHLDQYEEAIFAYEEFASLHPRNEAIPYVIYQIGMCYYNQLSTTDRDQEPAAKALDIFTRLQKQYPADTYAKKAREHIKKCYKSMAAHDLYVGKFYYKSKHYQAALERFKTVISKYPDTGVHQEALKQIALCEAKIAKQSAPKK